MSKQQTQPIRVSCRIRPYLPREIQSRNLISSTDEEIEVGQGFVAINNKTGRHVYTFSSVHGPTSTQLEVFNQDVAPLLQKIYLGLSCTIFSYGVTGSGKTHTMQGIPTSSKEMGIIPRVVKSIFGESARGQMEVCVEYMEIYKEECYDLFEPWVTRDQRKKLDIRTDERGQNVVAGLSQIPISSPEEFDILYTRAASRRVTAETKLNAESSRSHAVLTLVVRMLQGDKIITGKINLVDLAGSENNKLTGNDKERMTESAKINQSLTTLGNVIDALNTGGPGTRIPYRNSKLTRILQDTLGGNSIGLLICALAPGSAFRQDTLNTLNFAQRSKQVESRVVINEKDNKPPPPPSHFAAIHKTTAFVPVRGESSQPSQLSFPPQVRPMKSIPRMSIAGGSRMSMAGGQRPPLTSFGMSNVAPVVPKGRVVSAGNPKGKGKSSFGGNGSMSEEQSSLAESEMVKAMIEAAVADALVKQAKTQASAYEARLLNLEKDMQAEKDKAAANELLNEARRYHDAAYAEDDYEQLSYALDAYTRAFVYVSGNKNVRNRIQDIQSAIEHNLPIPPRKAAAAAASSSTLSAVASHSTRPASAMSLTSDERPSLANSRRSSSTLPKAKKIHLSDQEWPNEPDEMSSESLGPPPDPYSSYRPASTSERHSSSNGFQRHPRSSGQDETETDLEALRWKKIQAAKAWLADHPDPVEREDDDDLGGYEEKQF